MMIFNVFSYVFAVITLGAILALSVWGWRPKLPRVARWGILIGYGISAILFNLLSRYPTTDQSTQAIEVVLGNGRPSFVMLYSNY
jgi:hypothetical protein